MRNKIIFWVVWAFSLAIIPLAIQQDIILVSVSRSPPATFNLILRILGMTAYVLLFWQIVSGAFFDGLEKKLGKWFLNFHIWQGIAGLSFALLHPIFLLFIKYFTGAEIDPIAVFLGFCLFCEKKRDFYLTLGRLGLILLAVGVMMAIFRKATTYIQSNWRKFHLLNYIVFILVDVHACLLGDDFTTSPFLYLAILINLLVIYTIIRKSPKFVGMYKEWLGN